MTDSCRLIDKLAKAPSRAGGQDVINVQGCPQGSILSPILANIFLNEVIDDWFEETRKHHLRGKAEEVRYADDMVFVFEHYEEAKRFFDVLPKRLAKYGLKVQQQKTRLIRSGQNAARRAYRQGRRLETYQFLGVTVYWGKARKGTWWQLKYTSQRKRFAQKLKGLKQFLRKELTTPNTTEILKKVVRGVVGWINYHAISDNKRRVGQFLRASRWIIWKWINRRGRRKPMNWTPLMAVLEGVKFPTRWKTVSMFKEEAC